MIGEWKRGRQGVRFREIDIDDVPASKGPKKYHKGGNVAYKMPDCTPRASNSHRGCKFWWPRWNFSFSSAKVAQEDWDRIFSKKDELPKESDLWMKKKTDKASR